MTTIRIPGGVRRVVLRLATSRRACPSGGGLDVSTISRFPARARLPLLRDGLDPVPELAAARARGDVTRLIRVLGLDVWLVTGHDLARTVLADRESYSNDVRHLLGTRPRSAAEEVGGLGMTDAPDHTRLRRVLTPQFTVRRLARLEAGIDRIVADCLDDMESAGPVVDLADRLAFAVPFRVICDLLGLPEVDRAAFRSLGTARFDLSNGGAGTFGAAATTREFLIDLVTRHRQGGAGLDPDGLIASIADDHPELSDVEVGGLADGVFLGGFETSASMLALGTLVLVRDRDAFASLATGDRDQVDRVVDELLRYVCPVQVAFPRFARTAMDLGGVRIAAGDLVLVSLTGASRDPRTSTADDFDPTSPASSHLAFGHGMHRCVGAELARMELRAALTGLARRFPDLDLAVDPGTLSFTPLSAVYGLESLPVRLDKETEVAQSA
ncbi:cytochrome P450 [Nocardioides currus]|uniref:Cytochrome P450 n=1 Tax=Nocardioides currus TaxID=2133958 RepID=A0A2R7YZD8_9ACTN|nr:cytochrome P450 [Nocardioides currus]PUA81721.1 cytochrome P450 [Nocardioides currus]